MAAIIMFLIGQPISAQNLTIAFDKNKNSTSTYPEIRQFYRTLDEISPYVQVRDYGMTDSGQPLQEVVVAADNHFTPEETRAAGKAVLLINNGIHPGEPDGIDASMIWMRNLVLNNTMADMLENMTIVIIPVYNIGGCLNRSWISRPDQNGPEEFGFRGNAKNLDLNRDFIKCDSKNARTFNQLFNKWNPDLMLDTHVSNGADYQHTISYVGTQKDKLTLPLKQLYTSELLPYFNNEMSKRGWDMVPYVFSFGPPETGIIGFMDHPRFSSGYAALHHTIAFMPETHMLKPYKDRVASTLDFIKTTMFFLNQNKGKVIQAKKEAEQYAIQQDSMTLTYKHNRNKWSKIPFKGYKAGKKPSAVSGKDRLYYDRNQPWTDSIRYYDSYEADVKVRVPVAYVIPQAYDHIINMLTINGVHLNHLSKDTIIEVEMYSIEDFETVKSPYESHYLHSKTQVSTRKMKRQFYKGDVLIYTRQKPIRYIVETLEPQGVDSWFNWNFFDGILSVKEYYSDYVFEDKAAQLLKENPDLKRQLDQKRSSDSKFAEDGEAQLDFVYKMSPYFEPPFRLYPIGRIVSQ